MGQYDTESQVLGQEAPEALLELFTGLRGAEAIRHDAKLSVSAVQPDHLYRHGDRLVQLEFAKQFRDSVLEQLLNHRAYIHLAYKRVEVRQVLIVMCRSDAPAVIPQVYHSVTGPFEQRIEFEVVKLWEMDPERVFALNHPSLLPWVMVMGSNAAQMRRALERMAADDRAALLIQRAATLAPLRLRQPEIDEIMREGKRSMKIKELVEGSWLYDEIRDEGRLATLREMIRRYALQRLPSAGPLPRLDAVQSAQELQECLDALVSAASPTTVRRAIERFQ